MRSFFRFSHCLALATALCLVSFLAVSCETWDEVIEDKPDNPKDKLVYVLTVHEIVKYPRAQQLEMEIPSFSGTPVCVNANYFLHSKNVPKIDIVEIKDNPGFYDINLTLDRRGRMLWTSLAVNFRAKQIGFVIDGVFYRAFIPEQLDDDNDMVVKIKGPFDTSTAMGLKKNAEKNYKVYNGKD